MWRGITDRHVILKVEKSSVALIHFMQKDL